MYMCFFIIAFQNKVVCVNLLLLLVQIYETFWQTEV